MKHYLLIFFIGLVLKLAGQPLASVSSGTLIRIENFSSKYVDPRPVDIWLPKDYSPEKRYQVTYMHDGQMLFDSTVTWNRQEWKVDETFSRLIQENKIEPCIIVGIWNNGKYRASEYFPEKFLETVSPDFRKKFIESQLENKPQSDRYLRFIVEELKPYIDSAFSTYTTKEHTFIMGSSRGGVISLYAMAEYPEVFGGAACLSSHWMGVREHNFELPLAAFNYFQKKLPSALSHRLYMDRGTLTLDSFYRPYQDFMDILVRSKGYSAGNLMTLAFEGTDHSEHAWAERLHIPVEFLMGIRPKQKPIAGKIDFYENFPSTFVSSRNIDVWLPEGYDSTKRYAVLYMNDGQMLFDATTTWNKQSWNIDDVASDLLKNGKLHNLIIVGIWNSGNTRHADYFPQKPYENLTFEEKSAIKKHMTELNWNVEGFQPNSDNYLRFIVKELKPFIDSQYSTYADAAHTFVMGSSMGGLISWYALTQYPEVFGGAACISTHWPGFMPFEGNAVPGKFIEYFKTTVKSIKKHKIYFDSGGIGLDANYPPIQKKMDDILKQNGFKEKNWITRYFPEADHTESDWNKRVGEPLLFLLGK